MHVTSFPRESPNFSLLQHNIGISSQKIFSPYDQWCAMRNYIRNYMTSHPRLTDEKLALLMHFNLQYLVKIADYRMEEALKLHRDKSPLSSKKISYQRDYRNDNLLLNEAVSFLKTKWPDAYVFLASNRSYLDYLKNLVCLIHFRKERTDEELLDKIHKKLNTYDSLDYDPKNLGLHLHLELEEDSDFDDISSKAVLLMEKIIIIIQEYPYTKIDPTNKNHYIFWAFSCNTRENVQILVTNGGLFLQAIKLAGSTPSIQQTTRTLAAFQFEPYQNLSRENKLQIIFPLELYPPLDRIIAIKKTFSLGDFLKNLELKKLISLVKTPSNLAQIVGKGLLQLLAGLFTLKLEGRFVNLIIDDFVFNISHRINYFINKLIEEKSSFIQFGKYADLIIEEIILFLLLTKPYRNGELEKISIEQLIKPWPRPCHVVFTEAGTNCFSKIITTVLKSRNYEINILYYNDIYFEHAFILKQLSTLNGLNKHHVTTFKVSLSEKKSDKESLFEQVRLLQNNAKKINAIFIDVHSSAQAGRKIQNSHEIIDIIDDLQTLNVLEDECTVAIDYTIGMWGSPEIKKILDKFKKEIYYGRLQFYIFRSTHKLDILGCDKFNGGMYLYYGKKTPPISKIKTTIASNSLDYQAYCHFYKFASDTLKDYYKTIVQNTNILYGRIDKEHIYNSLKKESSIYITQKNDKSTIYIEIGFKKISPFYEEFLKVLINSQFHHTRDSFGFRETTIVNIEEHENATLRITCGLEEMHFFVKFANFLNYMLTLYKRNL